MEARLKRVLSLVLATVMVIGMMPVNIVFAEGDVAEYGDEPVVCTGQADCPADTHEETCLRKLAEEEAAKQPTDPPKPACSAAADCAAETHGENCPKAACSDCNQLKTACICCPDCDGTAENHSDGCIRLCAKKEGCAEGKHDAECPLYLCEACGKNPCGCEEPKSECSGAADCAADTHAENCLKKLAEEEAAKQPTDPPKPDCTGLISCAAESHEDTCEKKIADDKAAADKAAADAVAALIEALPTLEQLQAMPIEEQTPYYNQVLAAYGTYCALTADQQALLPPAEDVFKPYFDYFNSLTAEAASHSHPICGSSCSCGGGHSSVSWTSFPTKAGTLSSGRYYLSADTTFSDVATFAITGNVSICLNGNTLTNVYVHVRTGGNLTLCDCSGNGVITNTTSIDAGTTFMVSNNGSMTMYGGTIEPTRYAAISCTTTGDLDVRGGSATGIYLGIYLDEIGSFRMSGGSAKGENEYGVAADYSTINSITISGGTIEGGVAGLLIEDLTCTGGILISGGTITGGDADVSLSHTSATASDAQVSLKGYNGAPLQVQVGASAAEGSYVAKNVSKDGLITLVHDTYCAVYEASTQAVKLGGSHTHSYDGITHKCSCGAIGGYCGDPSVSSGKNLIWEFDEGTGILTITGSGAMADYEDTDAPWDTYSTQITTISLPEGLTRIGYGAFSGTEITSIAVPDTVTYIDDYAFSSCQNLIDVDLGDGCSLGEGAFIYCPVKNLQLGNSRSFGTQAFTSSYIKSITITANSPIFREGAFWNCTNLEEVHFTGSAPSQVTDKGYISSLASFRDVTWYYDCNQTGWTTSSRYSAANKTWAGYSLVSERHAFVDATCTAPKTCSKCGATEGDPLDHTGGTATCKDKAVCTRCGEPHGELNGANHAGGTEIKNAKAATCTEAGYTGDTYCLGCNQKIATGKTTTGEHSYENGVCSVCQLPEGLKYSISNEKVTITDYAGTATSIVIPATIEGCPVTSIGYAAFSGCSSLTNVSIPESVTSIGNDAFMNCSGLKSVVIPEGTTSIGTRAFFKCSGLESVTIADSVVSIGSSAFSYCSGLTNIAIPAGVTKIESDTFSNCTGLKNIVIPKGITEIGSVAFLYCKNVTGVVIPSTVTSIGQSAFSSCKALEDVYYESTDSDWNGIAKGSDNDRLLNARVHYRCADPENHWKENTVDPTCTEPGYTTGVCKCATPYTRNKVESGTALGHTGGTATCKDKAVCTRCGEPHGELNGANHAGGTEIKNAKAATCTEAGYTGDTYCLGCNQKIATGKTTTGEHNYENGVCSVCQLPEGLKYSISNETVTITDYTGTAAGIKIPATIEGYQVTSIGSSAFRDCSSLTSIVIPDGVANIGDAAFSGCGSLTDVYYGGTSDQWTALGDHRPDAERIHYSCTDAEKHWQQVTEDATCTEAGYTAEVCECATSYTRNKVESGTALGHDMGGWTATEVAGEERSDCSRCDHYETRTAQPENILKLEDENLKNQSVVYINGLPYPVKSDGEDRYVEFESDEDCMLATYTYHVGDAGDVHTQYPTGMKVYRISNGEITYIPELDNLLQYSGSSIRVTGKKGIRMITSLYRNTKAALTGGGLAGYKLVEYGTMLCWSNEIPGGDALVLGKSFTRSNYAYKRGVADPVFANKDKLTQYTNVLVGFTNEQCKDDIAMRSYIILEDAEGKQFTVYGGTIHRSIGYIAYQNRKAFSVGSGAYNYVWDIIHFVYGDQYDADYKG